MASRITQKGVVVDAKLIRELRQSFGMSQDKLAQAAGCSKRTVENAEAGKRVSFRTCQELADALRVSVNSLVASKKNKGIEANIANVEMVLLRALLENDLETFLVKLRIDSEGATKLLRSKMRGLIADAITGHVGE